MCVLSVCLFVDVDFIFSFFMGVICYAVLELYPVSFLCNISSYTRHVTYIIQSLHNKNIRLTLKLYFPELLLSLFVLANFQPYPGSHQAQTMMRTVKH